MDAIQSLTIDVAAYAFRWRRLLLTFFADEYMAQVSLTPIFGHNPRTVHPWWIVPDVLGVSTLQVRHPVSLLILMKANNTPLHASLPRLDIVFGSDRNASKFIPAHPPTPFYIFLHLKKVGLQEIGAEDQQSWRIPSQIRSASPDSFEILQ